MTKKKVFFIGIPTLLLLLLIGVSSLNKGYYLLWAWIDKNIILVLWGVSELTTLHLPLDTYLQTSLPIVHVAAFILYFLWIGRCIKPSVKVLGNRIHHYHLGVAAILLGMFLLFGDEYCQEAGLGLLVGGVTFVVIDLKDFYKHLRRRF